VEPEATQTRNPHGCLEASCFRIYGRAGHHADLFPVCPDLRKHGWVASTVGSVDSSHPIQKVLKPAPNFPTAKSRGPRHVGCARNTKRSRKDHRRSLGAEYARLIGITRSGTACPGIPDRNPLPGVPRGPRQVRPASGCWPLLGFDSGSNSQSPVLWVLNSNTCRERSRELASKADILQPPCAGCLCFSSLTSSWLF
jgi:hypothetical protein